MKHLPLDPRALGPLLPGLALSAGVAAIATLVGDLPWFRSHGIGVLTLAIVLGMGAANTVYPALAATAGAGVAVSKQTLLRLGIILYGLRLTFQDIAHVGVAGVVIDALMLTSTFGLAWWMGTRILGLDRTTTMLIGAGSSICGAAAVMAAEPVLKGRADQVTVAVATVVVFGTLAMFLYPALYQLNAHYHVIGASPALYGVFTGSTVHEVAQVVAAGNAVSDAAGNTAVITKMVRVMMLAPFLLSLSTLLARLDRRGAARAEDGAQGVRGDDTRGGSGVVIPWFAVIFVAVAGLNSLAILPSNAVHAAVSVDTFILAMAMAALGLNTRWSSLRTAGIKPLVLAAVLFTWLILGGLAITGLVTAIS